MVRAVCDGGLIARVTSFDPEPRAALSGLSHLDLIRLPIKAVDRSVIQELTADDILFVDSSHKRQPCSDVAFIFEALIPQLVSSTQVHFHDIFLLDGYPAGWAHRRYNEQVSVAGLLASGVWQVDFSSAHAVRRLADEIDRSVAGDIPLVAGAIESSLWLRKL